MTDTEDRVRIWNSFFALAREEAKKVYEISENCKTKDDWFQRGGKLPDEALHKKVSKEKPEESFLFNKSKYGGSIMKRQILCLIMVFFILTVFVSSKPLLAAPYYEGKVLKIIVGFTPGGGYDRMARLLAKHLSKHIPGRPAIVVQNMEGASSIIASNYLYNIAKPDGLTIGTFIATLPFAQLLKIEGVKFDIRKYSWIGSSAIESYVLTLRTDLPYKTIEDLEKAKDPIPLGCSGVATMDYQFPLLLKGFIGLNFKMVVYVSSAEAMLGVERKEVVGRAGYYSSLMPFIERGLVRPWIRGRVSRPGIENLPVNEDLTTDKTGKAIMAMFSVTDIIGRPYVAPPGTPAEIVNILREAFAKVTKDPQLKEESKKMMMDVEYTPAEEVLKIINFLLNQPEDIVKEFSKYVKF